MSRKQVVYIACGKVMRGAQRSTKVMVMKYDSLTGQIIATNPPRLTWKWWFSKGKFPKIPEEFRF